MIPAEPHDEPAAPPRWVAYAETLVLSVGLPLAARSFHPADPLFLHGGFCWPLLGPLLAGLRYGVAHGLGGALLLDGLFALAAGAGSVPGATYPYELFFAALCLAGLAGEFCDAGERRAERLRAQAGYRRERLDQFARAHELLRMSHDRLAFQLAGAPSLRDALAELRLRLSRLPGQASRAQLAQEILALLAEHASVHAASLHLVDASGKPQPALANLGQGSTPLDDLLLAEAVRSRKLVHCGNDAQGALLAAVPLVDVRGELRALVAVREMPFLAFGDENLELLAVLGGHLGDLLSTLQGLGDGGDGFEQKVARSLADAKRFGIAATLARIEAVGPRARELLAELLEARRGLDPALALQSARGPALLILLQLTGPAEAEGYRARMNALIAARGAGREVEIALAPLDDERMVRELWPRPAPAHEEAPHARPAALPASL